MNALLSVSGLEAGYDGSQVLFGVDLDIGSGEVVSLMGRNGMGKTTFVHAVMGLLRATAGRIVLRGAGSIGRSPVPVAQAGIGLVPEGRQIFPTPRSPWRRTSSRPPQTGSCARTAGRWSVPRLPAPACRAPPQLGDQISGGEQRMLAIGRALMINPQLLILDEATEGLAP
jgi:branched-chain amino acid transport system ATP-binding protein